MAVKTKKVEFFNGPDGRGVKVSARNFENVAEWADGEALFKRERYHTEITNQRVKVKTKKGWRVAQIGDTVVKLTDGLFVVVKAEDFATTVKI